jgi:hypothetical protein
MEYVWVSAGVAGLLGLIGWFVWRWFHRAGQEIQLSRAAEAFRLQRERLETMFFETASVSGKPRGLLWKKCEFNGELELARDKITGELVGLLPVTIAFEAVAGSDMEGLPAVGNLRNASAVFTFRKGSWSTVGRAVFNLNPDEAIRHFQSMYEHVEEKKI